MAQVNVMQDSENEKQDALAFLRERYLYLLSNLCGKSKKKILYLLFANYLLVAGRGDCEIKMYENTNVKCQIKAFDSNFENIIVENLQTPIPGTINKAILRTSDIISMKFNCDYTKLIK